MDIIAEISRELALRPDQVAGAAALLAEGATVPFIARYRKEKTGNLDETEIRDVAARRAYFIDLDERRETVLETIRSQGKLVPELEKKILTTTSKTELEDLYLPYKPKRLSRATKARAAGLEPLARWIAELEDPQADLQAAAAAFVDPEKGIDTAAKALQGAGDILAEEMSDDAEIRKRIRELALREGFWTTSVRKEFEGQKTKFEMYHDYREKAAEMPSHRFLAMLRGEREKVLRLDLEFPLDKAAAFLESGFILHPKSAAAPLLRETVKDSLNRLLAPATETEVRKELRGRAEKEAFKVFGDNLRDLLLSPPAGRRSVLGVDPGFRTGCKVAAVDPMGRFLEFQAIYPHEPHSKTEEAGRVLRRMIEDHGIELIAVGNGTAGRETESFVRETLAGLPASARPACVMVSESGASVYSASETAGREFPDFDVTVRGAISIARRLQDPLSELVKIDPKSIGVGQYQHDVDQAALKVSLEDVVESCVNSVGVDVNLASEELLKYVSGLTRRISAAVVRHREEEGSFRSREDLKNVPGLGAKTFEQAAGFLRVPGSRNPLDNSAVHPERYDFVEKIAAELGTTVDRMIGESRALRSLDPERFVSGDLGLPTVEDILRELEKAGRDPRSEFKYATFSESIREISDLTLGMTLEGVVTNVTNFGAFVDIGVHQDGLVHVSELADRYVPDPRQVVRVGQVVKVRVLKVDPEMKRIALSMKTG
jgi:protein Tex